MELKAGDSADIVLGERRYACRVEAVSGDGGLTLSAPRYHDVPVVMQDGELLQVVYYRHTGVYAFLARYERTRPDAAVQISMRSPITKHQRRDFVRLEADLPVAVRVIRTAEQMQTPGEDTQLRDAILGVLRHRVPRTEEGLAPLLDCRTTDISGGGLCIRMPCKPELQCMMECVLGLPGGQVVADAAVTRCAEAQQQAGFYDISVRFVRIEERTRRKILKYIFEHQEG